MKNNLKLIFLYLTSQFSTRSSFDLMQFQILTVALEAAERNDSLGTRIAFGIRTSGCSAADHNGLLPIFKAEK